MLNICGHALREDALVSTLSQAQYFLVIPSAVLLKTESTFRRLKVLKMHSLGLVGCRSWLCRPARGPEMLRV